MRAKMKVRRAAMLALRGRSGCHHRSSRSAAPSTVSGAHGRAISGATRYAPLNQINASNFNNLQIAWRFKTENLGKRPDFNLLPSGVGAQFMKQFTERGLDKSGIKLIATGDVTDDDILNEMGDVALGVTTSHHYSASHKSALNQKFVAEFRQGEQRHAAELLRRWAATTACASS